jgi:hypothetical protein
MAKGMSRRNRRANRKSRRANRKSRRNTRRNNMMGGMGLFGKIYSPVGHALAATTEAVGTVTNTVGSVAKTGLRGVNRIGRSVTGHANMAVRNVFSRKRKASRRAGRR